ALPLERDRPVGLLYAMAGIVVRVLVALAVAELAQAGMPGSLLQVQRHGVHGRGVLRGTAEGRDHAVRLRRLGQVDGGLGEVQPRLGQPHVLDGLGSRHRDEEARGSARPMSSLAWTTMRLATYRGSSPA